MTDSSIETEAAVAYLADVDVNFTMGSCESFRTQTYVAVDNIFTGDTGWAGRGLTFIYVDRALVPDPAQLAVASV